MINEVICFELILPLAQICISSKSKYLHLQRPKDQFVLFQLLFILIVWHCVIMFTFVTLQFNFYYQMKKVNRRVIERTEIEQPNNNNPNHPFLQPQHPHQNHPPPTHHHQQSKNQQTHKQSNIQQQAQHSINGSSEATKAAKDQLINVKKNIADQISISPNSNLKSENTASQVSQNTSTVVKKSQTKTGEEQRKSKIEQLKQKYLKKNTAQTKPQINKITQIKRQIPIEKTPVAISIPKIQLHQQPISENVSKEQKKAIILQQQQPIRKVQQKIEQQHKEVINTKVFKPPIPNNLTKPKVVPVIKQKQQQISNTQVPISNQSIVKQDQPSNIKSNKAVFPPPPKIKNTPKNPPAIVPKHIEPSHQTSNKNIEPTNQHQIAHQQVKVVQNIPQQPQQVKKEEQLTKSENAPILGTQQQIRLWLDSPATILSKLIPYIDQVNNSEQPNFTFSSKNTQFNSALNDFLVQFVLRNKNGLSQGQKTALYNFALQYFVDNEQISKQLLLILIKLGNSYLAKHSASINKNLQLSSQLIALNRSFFNNEELSIVVGLLSEQKELVEKEIIQLLLIYPTERLVSVLSNKTFNNLSNILVFLSFIHLKKEFNIFIMFYLKLINTLIDNLPQNTQLAEKILKHLNELQTNDKSYQLHKQIKLKLINLISKSQSQEVKPSKTEVKEQKNDGGLVGYWSKAVDKIKTATTQLVELKEPSKPVPKQQQKQDDIVYDPVLKRYLINGKVPDDQNDRPKDNPTSKAPPPPKQGNKPVPPPLPGKKGKVTTNRYA